MIGIDGGGNAKDPSYMPGPSVDSGSWIDSPYAFPMGNHHSNAKSLSKGRMIPWDEWIEWMNSKGKDESKRGEEE